jgi:hypothetical protein
MNEGDESIESTETRKKKRRSGFRYSSRRTAKVGGIQFESVTKALSYPSEIGDIVHYDCATGSSFLPCLDSVEEHDGDGMELSCDNAITYKRCNIKISDFYIHMII